MNIHPNKEIVDNSIDYIKSMLCEMSNAEFAEKFGVSSAYIANYLSKNSIKRNKQNLKSKKCSKCKNIKTIDKFRKIKTGYRADCLDCEKKFDRQYKEINKSEILLRAKKRYKDNILQSLLNNIKGRSIRKGMDFDLDMEYLKIRWTGRCELSGIEFEKEVSKRQNPFRPSIDRIDNSKGYLKGNIRVILWGLNLAINSYGLETYLKIANGVLKNDKAAKSYFGEFANLNFK